MGRDPAIGEAEPEGLEAAGDWVEPARRANLGGRGDGPVSVFGDNGEARKLSILRYLRVVPSESGHSFAGPVRDISEHF